MRRLIFGAVGALTFAFAAGCGPSPPPIVPVEGVVLLNGAPLPKAKVRFYPKIDNQTKYFAEGVTDASGRYTLTCRGQPGACAAENIVIIAEDEIPPDIVHDREKADEYRKSLINRPIPPQYRDLNRSTVVVTVTPDKKEYPIELTR